eukprot:scaffold1050_cov176-Ochromonas_danica.AAC.3
MSKPSNVYTVVTIYAIGISVVCGRQIAKWNKGYAQYDFPLFFVVMLVYMFTLAMLTFCFSELVSMVPFSGGCYGYSRCALGPFLGYLAGMVEAAKYILFTTFSIYSLGEVFHDAFGFDKKYDMLIWVAFLVIYNVVHFFKRQWLWMLVWLTGAMVLIVQFIFIFGSASHGSIASIKDSNWDSHPQDFLRAFFYVAYLLSALDAVRTCVDEEGSGIVPKALLHIMTWAIVSACASVVAQAAYNYNNSALVGEEFAYNMGLRIALSLSEDNKYVTLFSLPGALGSSTCYFYCAARQVRSMASSGLLPPFLAMGHGKKVRDSSQPDDKAIAVVPAGDNNGVERSAKLEAQATSPDDLLERDAPTVALLACSILCLILLVVAVAYIVFITRFSNMERVVKNPFGMMGALVPMAFFVYYFWVVEKRQFFSKEEQQKFMKAYIVNANKNRRRVKVASGSGRENGKPSSKLLRIWTGALGFTSKVSSHKGSGRSSISTMSALAPKVYYKFSMETSMELSNARYYKVALTGLKLHNSVGTEGAVLFVHSPSPRHMTNTTCTGSISDLDSG